MLLNLSNGNTTKMQMYTPIHMTEYQKEQIVNLYETLSNFDEVNIIIPKSIFIKDDDCIHNLETFFKIYNIKISGKIK